MIPKDRLLSVFEVTRSKVDHKTKTETIIKKTTIVFIIAMMLLGLVAIVI